MDKLLFYSLNSEGLPNGPNFNRTGMLGKLSMFNHGGDHYGGTKEFPTDYFGDARYNIEAWKKYGTSRRLPGTFDFDQLDQHGDPRYFDSDRKDALRYRSEEGTMIRTKDGFKFRPRGMFKSSFEMVDGGEIVSPGDGWNYKQIDDEIYTKRENSSDWIVAKGAPRQAIETKIFNEPPTNSNPPEELITDNISNSNDVIQIQTKLKGLGYNLGNYGINKDGVDGVYGTKTKEAVKAYNQGVDPQTQKVQDTKVQNEIVSEDYKTKPQTFDYVSNIQGYLNDKGFVGKNGKSLDTDGIMGTNTLFAIEKYKSDAKSATLPVFPSTNPREETCKNSGDGYGCSRQVTLKLGSLFTPTSMEKAQQNLWASDAWFNKDNVEKNGGLILYENNDSYENKGELPKELYGLFQVGDYVHLDRKNTSSSAKYAKAVSEIDPSLKNEKIEHLGMIVGADTDGTPLIWHSSESGKAYIKRVDEPITLDDHKSLGAYKISSIARSGKMEDKFQNEVAQNPYYIALDKDNELTWKEDGKSTTGHENIVINSMPEMYNGFKNIGITQDEANKMGSLLLGIMNMETNAGESTDPMFTIPFTNVGPSKSDAKFAAAYTTKDLLGIDKDTPLVGKYGKKFAGDEASRGLYQMKTGYNFNTSKMKSLLKQVGINSVDDIMKNETNQFKAAMILMNENYKSLKKDPNYNAEDDTWTVTDPETLQNFTYPASYLLAGTWPSGAEWYNKPHWRKILTSGDQYNPENTGRTYSMQVLQNVADKFDTEKGINYGAEGLKIAQDAHNSLIVKEKDQSDARRMDYKRNEDKRYEVHGGGGPRWKFDFKYSTNDLDNLQEDTYYASESTNIDGLIPSDIVVGRSKDLAEERKNRFALPSDYDQNYFLNLYNNSEKIVNQD